MKTTQENAEMPMKKRGNFYDVADKGLTLGKKATDLISKLTQLVQS